MSDLHLTLADVPRLVDRLPTGAAVAFGGYRGTFLGLLGVTECRCHWPGFNASHVDRVRVDRVSLDLTPPQPGRRDGGVDLALAIGVAVGLDVSRGVTFTVVHGDIYPSTEPCARLLLYSYGMEEPHIFDLAAMDEGWREGDIDNDDNIAARKALILVARQLFGVTP
jgi:hypothetical protein